MNERRVQLGDANKWHRLSGEEYAVMITAHEHGLVTQVLDGWRAPQRWAETGTSTAPSDLTDDDKRRLAPGFALVIRHLATAGLIDVTEHFEADIDPVTLAGDNLAQALSDPRAWIWRADMDFRALALTTTPAWDEQHPAVG